MGLVLGEAASTETGRGRDTCFSAGRCGVRLNVRRLAKGRGRRLNDGGSSWRLLHERTLTKRGLAGGSDRGQSRITAVDSTRRLRGSGGCALNSGAWMIWTVETGGRPGASDGALGADAMSGLSSQHRIDHRIVDCVFGTRPLRAFGIASVGVGRSSNASLLTSLFLSGYTGQLGFGRLLISLPETLVALSLGIIDHPVASLARIGDRPWDLAERLV